MSLVRSRQDQSPTRNRFHRPPTARTRRRAAESTGVNQPQEPAAAASVKVKLGENVADPRDRNRPRPTDSYPAWCPDWRGGGRMDQTRHSQRHVPHISDEAGVPQARRRAQPSAGVPNEILADLARRDPRALNVLAPFLTDEQFDDIVGSNLTDDEANDDTARGRPARKGGSPSRQCDARMKRFEFCENHIFLKGRPIDFNGRPYLSDL